MFTEITGKGAGVIFSDFYITKHLFETRAIALLYFCEG